MNLLRENDINDINEIAALQEATRNGQNPAPAGGATEDLRSLLESQTKSVLTTIPRSGLQGVRVNVWRKRESTADRIMVHVVNYYCPSLIESQTSESQIQVRNSPQR